MTKPQRGHFAKAKVEPKAQTGRVPRRRTTRWCDVGAEITRRPFRRRPVRRRHRHEHRQGLRRRHEAAQFRAACAPRTASRSRTAASARPGSGRIPGKTFKNKKMAGHMGNERVTTQSLESSRVDAERGLILVKGSVPGAEEGLGADQGRGEAQGARRAAVPGGAARQGQRGCRRAPRRRPRPQTMKVAMKLVATSTTRRSATSSWPTRCSALPVRQDILARVVNWQLAKRRAGTHKTKGISDIAGTDEEAVQAEGHRPRPPGQPALAAVPRRRGDLRTGRAQPRVRPAEEGAEARRSRPRSSAKQAEGKLIVIDEAKVDEAKTKALRAALRAARLGVGADHRRRRGRRGFRPRRAQPARRSTCCRAGRQRLRHPAPRHAGPDPGRGARAWRRASNEPIPRHPAAKSG